MPKTQEETQDRKESLMQRGEKYQDKASNAEGSRRELKGIC